MKRVPSNALNQLVTFFSRFADLCQSAPIRLHEDGLIETPVGCFRIALTQKHECTALFYARHPDDLAAVDIDGHLRFLHPERMLMLGSHKIHDPPEMEADGRLRYDVGWAKSFVETVNYHLPRILLREANLFRFGNDHRSQYVSYQPVPVAGKNGPFHINIYTNPHMTYNLAAVESTAPRIGKKPPLSRTRNYLLSSQYLLRVKQEVEDGAPRIIDMFETENVSRVILSKFHKQSELAWKGIHPVTWEEKANLPLFTLSSRLRWEFNKFIERMKDGEERIRFGGKNLISAGIGWFIPFAGVRVWADSIFDVGRPYKHAYIREELKPMVQKHLSRFASMRTDLHKMLLQCDPAMCGDLEALHPAKHVFNFFPGQVQLVKRDRRRELGSWIKRHFLASYVASWRFYSPDKLFTDTKNLAKTEVVKQIISNGMKVYVVPKTRELFAYFSDDGFEVENRKYPCAADRYFRKDTVLRLSLDDLSDHFTEMDFDVFEKYIRRLTNAPTLEIQRPQKLPAERINYEPQPWARGAMHPVNLVAPFPNIFPS